MERSLKELKLPNSKYKAKIVTFFTRGESKELRTKRNELGGKTKYVGNDVVIEDIPADYRQ